MEKLLGSRLKALVLLALGLRGGATGRRLARVLKSSPTPVFKALQGLISAGVVCKTKGPFAFYSLDPRHSFYPEIVRMIHKEAQGTGKKLFPKEKNKIDPIGVYQLLEMTGRRTETQKLSDRLRELYA